MTDTTVQYEENNYKTFKFWDAKVELSNHIAYLTEGFNDFWNNYVDPDTGIVYDVPMSETAVWPTPEEVKNSIPTINGWDTAIENAPGEGGPLLAGLSLGAFDIPEEMRCRYIDHIFKGLVSLWEIPGRTGFICRGYLKDGKEFYIQTSNDQIPLYLMGLWIFSCTRYADENQKSLIKEIFNSVLGWLKSNNWYITLFDGTPAVHGNFANLSDPGIARMLGLLLMAYDLTSEEEYLQNYINFRDQDDRVSFSAIADRNKIWHPYSTFYQTLYLWILEQLESDQECRDFYKEQRKWFVTYLGSYCSNHIYERFSPVGRDEGKTVNIKEDKLIDWRPAWKLASEDPESGNPEKPTFWYSYRLRLEQIRKDQGLNNDGWLTYDFFTLLGTYSLVKEQSSLWGYYGPAECLRSFFKRLSINGSTRFFPKLALALGIKKLRDNKLLIKDQTCL
ncbi:MAG: hypothetical protein ACYTFY_14425 [Planctomycetota bacterium]